jgi:hypothetical protein
VCGVRRTAHPNPPPLSPATGRRAGKHNWGQATQRSLLSSALGLGVAGDAVYNGAEELLRTQDTAVDFFNAKIERYPNHLGRTILWVGASTLYGVRERLDQDIRQIVLNSWL